MPNREDSSKLDTAILFSGDLIVTLLSNQGEKRINLFLIMVPFKEKSFKVWYSKAQVRPFKLYPNPSGSRVQGLRLGGSKKHHLFRVPIDFPLEA